MRLFLTILTLIISCTYCIAQEQQPIQWNVEVQRVDSNHYSVTATMHCAEGWYAYAANAANDVDGISLNWNNENIISNGLIQSSVKASTINDKVFSTGMLVWHDGTSFTQGLKAIGKTGANLKVTVKGFASNGTAFLPIEHSVVLILTNNAMVNNRPDFILKGKPLQPMNNCGQESNADKSMMGIFLLGVFGGLIALLTPCVFPMIPVTVGYFTNSDTLREPQCDSAPTLLPFDSAQGDNKRRGTLKALLYGLFIFLIYVLASVPFHLMGNINPQVFNTISTNAVVNLVFFVVFIVFALSFFGVFHISLPSSITNKVNDKSGLHIGGIFFMALTLAIVSFSCTGPILGSLLVSSISSDKGAWQLSAGMGGFGIALALPFALFAMFPNWMGKLPKSGGWLNTVKVTLAFVELALALKFLSNADLVKHWGILKREVFIGLWIVIALCLAYYLTQPLLKERGKTVSKGRIVFGGMVMLFALYLTPGLTQTKYANLKLLSGFPPPLSYSIYGKDNVKGKGVEPNVVNDYNKALQLAKEQHKPLLLDFTGWACVNCRKMEEQVWTKPEIAAMIKEKFILVSLYVDDRKLLAPEEQFIHGDKEVRTLGDLYALMESENFKQVSQPLYVILDNEEQLMNYPVGYTPNVKKYKEWLECGIAANEQVKKD